MKDIVNYWSRLDMKSILALVFLSWGAGLLLSILGAPIPWFLGPFFVAVFYNTASGKRGFMPVGVRNAALVVMGYSMGRLVTATAAHQIIMSLPLMFASTAFLILFSWIQGCIISRKTGISLESGILGSIPGGTVQMVVMAEDMKKADSGVVMLMQIPRILVTLLVVPFVAQCSLGGTVAFAGSTPSAGVFPFVGSTSLPGLAAAFAGGWLACRLRLPTPYFLGAVLGTAVLGISGYGVTAVPRELLNVAQLFFSAYMGLGVNLADFKRLGKVLAYGAGGAVILVGFAFLLGYGLSWATSIDLVTAFLATAPGGVAEMSLTAMVLHTDVVTVLAYQSFRLIFILLAMPPFLKWRLNK